MMAAGSILRALVAIVQIVAFVAFTIPDPAHALAGDRHCGHAHAALSSDHGTAHHLSMADGNAAADASGTVALTDRDTRGQTPDPACLGCGLCQVFAQAPDAVAMPQGTRRQSIPLIAASDFASIAAEALPKPPRHLA